MNAYLNLCHVCGSHKCKFANCSKPVQEYCCTKRAEPGSVNEWLALNKVGDGDRAYFENLDLNTSKTKVEVLPDNSKRLFFIGRN